MRGFVGIALELAPSLTQRQGHLALPAPHRRECLGVAQVGLRPAPGEPGDPQQFADVPAVIVLQAQTERLGTRPGVTFEGVGPE